MARWESLFPGDRVEVWTNPHNAFKGTVSDSTEDGQIIWVIEDGIGTRQMIHRDDQPTVYRTFDQTPDEAPTLKEIFPK